MANDQQKPYPQVSSTFAPAATANLTGADYRVGRGLSAARYRPSRRRPDSRRPLRHPRRRRERGSAVGCVRGPTKPRRCTVER